MTNSSLNTGARDSLLLVELRMLGDAVMALPFVRTALGKYDVYVLCRPQTAPLFSGLLGQDRILEWSPPWVSETGKYRLSSLRAADPRELVTRIRSLGIDVAVCSWADARAQAIIARSGIPARIGFPMTSRNYLAVNRPWRRRNLLAGRAIGCITTALLGRRLLTHSIDRKDYSQHHVEDWRQVAGSLDMELDTTAPWICPGTSGERGWLMHSGGRLPSKRWPLDRFQKLVDGFFSDKDLVIVKPPECDAPNPNGAGHSLVTTESITDLVDEVAKAAFVICNDSFVSHLAGAMGKRVVTIFSSGLPDWFAPYGNADLVVASDACPHRPCMDRCVMPSYVCLEDVSVEMVEDKLRLALDTTDDGGKRT